MFDNMQKGKKIFYIALLFLPLVLAIAWLVYIKVGMISGSKGVFLSPVNNAPIIIALMVFIVGYLLFLFMMFFPNIKEGIVSMNKGK